MAEFRELLQGSTLDSVKHSATGSGRQQSQVEKEASKDGVPLCLVKGRSTECLPTLSPELSEVYEACYRDTVPITVVPVTVDTIVMDSNAVEHCPGNSQIKIPETNEMSVVPASEGMRSEGMCCSQVPTQSPEGIPRVIECDTRYDVSLAPNSAEMMVVGNNTASHNIPTTVEISYAPTEPVEPQRAIDSLCPKTARERRPVRKHSSEFKAQVVKFARDNSNRSASKKFDVDEKQVRRWRKEDLQPDPERPRAETPDNNNDKRVKRKYYDVSFKIAAIEFAEANSNRLTGREFGVDEKQIRLWRKQKERLKNLQPGKKRLSGGGRKPACPALEDKLVAWIEEQKMNNSTPTCTNIKAKALELSRDEGSTRTVDFTASHGWLYSFFRRKQVSLDL